MFLLFILFVVFVFLFDSTFYSLLSTLYSLLSTPFGETVYGNVSGGNPRHRTSMKGDPMIHLWGGRGVKQAEAGRRNAEGDRRQAEGNMRKAKEGRSQAGGGK